MEKEVTKRIERDRRDKKERDVTGLECSKVIANDIPPQARL